MAGDEADVLNWRTCGSSVMSDDVGHTLRSFVAGLSQDKKTESRREGEWI